jgi:cyclophilin family peptidyl-prolyl cis-trans isomerase
MSELIPNPHVSLTVEIDGILAGTMTFEIFREDDILQGALNFVLMCRGYLEGQALTFARGREEGEEDDMEELEGFERSKVSYEGTRFTTIIPGQYVASATGLPSIYGEPPNDAFACRGVTVIRKHTRGTLGLIRRPHGAASSAFYIALAEAPWLDDAGEVIGRLTSGDHVLHKIESSDPGVSMIKIRSCAQL